MDILLGVIAGALVAFVVICIAGHLTAREVPVPSTARPVDGREMTRTAFAAAIASGKSPGAASLLAEVERGWDRADEMNRDGRPCPGDPSR